MVAAALVITGLALPAAVADTDPLAIDITAVTPTVLTNSGNLVVAGIIRNVSTTPVDDISVWLWRDATPLTHGLQLQRSVGNEGGAASQDPQASVLIDRLEPNGSARFSVQASLDPNQAVEPLWLNQPDAAYRVGVEAYGRTAGQPITLVGASRFFMAHPSSSVHANTAAVVELSARPGVLPALSGAVSLIDAGLPAQLSGRLNELLNAAEQPNTAAIIDPALYDEVSLLASGALVGGQAPDAATVQVAKTWLSRVDALAGSHRLFRSLYASPDVAAAAQANRPDVLQHAMAALAADHKLASLPLLVHPRDGIADPKLVDYLRPAKAVALLASNVSPSGSPISISGDLPVLRVIETASQDTDVVNLRARQLISALEGFASVQIVDDAASAQALAQAPTWLAQTSFLQVLAAKPSNPTSWLAPSNQPVAASLIQQSNQVVTQLTTWGQLTGSSQQMAKTTDQVVAQLWSSWWTGSGQAATARGDWLAKVTAPAAQINDPSSLQLRISNSVTTSKDDNLLPVTVVNTLPSPVQVRVQFISDNPQRISIPQTDVVQVSPGESTTVRVHPRSQANGPVTMHAQLVTVGGQQLGKPVEFTVTATEAGQVGWIIILASGALFLLVTSLRVRQVRRLGGVRQAQEASRLSEPGRTGGSQPAHMQQRTD